MCREAPVISPYSTKLWQEIIKDQVALLLFFPPNTQSVFTLCHLHHKIMQIKLERCKNDHPKTTVIIMTINPDHSWEWKFWRPSSNIIHRGAVFPPKPSCTYWWVHASTIYISHALKRWLIAINYVNIISADALVSCTEDLSWKETSCPNFKYIKPYHWCGLYIYMMAEDKSFDLAVFHQFKHV